MQRCVPIGGIVSLGHTGGGFAGDMASPVLSATAAQCLTFNNDFDDGLWHSLRKNGRRHSIGNALGCGGCGDMASLVLSATAAQSRNTPPQQ
jgi:hypothetical protein